MKLRKIRYFLGIKTLALLIVTGVLGFGLSVKISYADYYGCPIPGTNTYTCSNIANDANKQGNIDLLNVQCKSYVDANGQQESAVPVNASQCPSNTGTNANAGTAPARQDYTGGGLVACGHSATDPCRVQDFFVEVARAINWLIAVAGVYAVFQIISHGFWLAVSAGEEEAITIHKKALFNVIIGFILALMAYMFVNTATNYLLRSKCRIDLTNPLTYLTISNYDQPNANGYCQ